MKTTWNLLIACLFTLNFSALIGQNHSIAREWNELVLTSIKNDFARPTIHARNLYHISAAMYDAWAAYDTIAKPFFLGKTVGVVTIPFQKFSFTGSVQQAREQAISYACYRMLRERFKNSPKASTLYQIYDAFMASKGYDINFTSVNYVNGDPRALGNYIASNLLIYGLYDKSNEQAGYLNRYYVPSNPPLIVADKGNPRVTDINRWQPLALARIVDQSGNVVPGNVSPFLSPEWGNVVPFSLSVADMKPLMRNNNVWPVYHDPGPPPTLDRSGNKEGIDDFFKWNFALVSTWSSHLTADDTTMWDISPRKIGNIQKYPEAYDEYRTFYDILQGQDAGKGYNLNPKTGQPYKPQIVKRGDYTRVLAEFWADGPSSTTPPGHWFEILNYVRDHPLSTRKFNGKGTELDPLEYDVKSYLMLGGTMHDVAVTIWGVKGYYDYTRPISAIRGMAELGQSTDKSALKYNFGGLPLIPGYIETIKPGDPLGGLNNENLGEIKIKAWRGPPVLTNPEDQVAGVAWILAKNWYPYQRGTFVTPPFAGYLSGHSTFSSAAAQILTYLTGDEYFPGGMGEFVAIKNEFLAHEDGPSQDITLQWARYKDASDQCSLSRIWGGIHPPIDDIPGRKIGTEIANDAISFAFKFMFQDKDNDGYASYLDCNDNDKNIHPDAIEICNNIDENCDKIINENLPIKTYYVDADGDGFGTSTAKIDTCLSVPPQGYADNNRDCADNVKTINPSILEVCDKIDNDCNGKIDDGLQLYTYYSDKDNDSFGDSSDSIKICDSSAPSGFTVKKGDCIINDKNSFPGANEICDGLDNDCDRSADEGLPTNRYYKDSDNDGYGTGSIFVDTCITIPPVGFKKESGDCNDLANQINPSKSEICDGIDNNCNGGIDDGLPKSRYYRDLDKDGFGDLKAPLDTCLATLSGYVNNSSDCNDNQNNINQNVAEKCNGIDDNCNGKIDEDLKLNRYYVDKDNDGFGDAASFQDTCITSPPLGYVADKTDCNDNLTTINPSMIDIAGNRVDEDCNGVDLYNKFDIVPNPFYDYFEIRVPSDGNYLVELYNQNGAIVFTEKFNTQNRVILIRPRNSIMVNLLTNIIYVAVFDADKKELLFKGRALKFE
jgi:hypothetical protein